MRCAWSRGGQSTRIGNSKFEIRVFLFSEVELRVLPILPLSRALKSRAMEMQPALLVFGDADMFRLEHVVQFYKLLGGAQQDAGFMREHMARNRLAILPDVTHYETFMSPSMTAAVLPFINGVNNAPSWANQVDAKN